MGINSVLKQLDNNQPGMHAVTPEEYGRIHEILLDAMDEISDFCKKNQIAWSLSGGNILGAVRHKGFIPWDDDIDLFMTRRDFERFYELFPKDSEKYEIKRPGDPGYLMHYPQIHLKKVIAKTLQSTKEEKGNLFIDIFIFENTYDNKFLRTLHGLLSTACLFVVSALRIEKCEYNLLKYGRNDKRLVSEVKKRKTVAKLFHFRSFEKWLLKSDRIFSKVKKDDTKYVVCPGGSKHFFGEIFLRNKVTKYAEADFEGRKYFVPVDADYYLNIRYGSDYMTPPPEGAQERHVYIDFDLGEEK